MSNNSNSNNPIESKDDLNTQMNPSCETDVNNCVSQTNKEYLNSLNSLEDLDDENIQVNDSSIQMNDSSIQTDNLNSNNLVNIQNIINNEDEQVITQLSEFFY